MSSPSSRCTRETTSRKAAAFSSASPKRREDEEDGGAIVKWIDAEDIGIALVEKFPGSTR